MSEFFAVQAGDLYCPRCVGSVREMTFETYEPGFLAGSSYDGASGSNVLFSCAHCGDFRHPFEADEQGRFVWLWDHIYSKPNPGCPWCGSCNINGVWTGEGVGTRGGPQHYYWGCRREGCRKYWLGFWVLSRRLGTMRWTIRVPVHTVPWVRATDTYPGFVRGVGPVPIPAPPDDEVNAALEYYREWEYIDKGWLG